MKTSKTNRIPCGAVDDSINAPLSKASRILNMRWNQKHGSWINDRGFSPWWQFPSSFTWDNVPAPLLSAQTFLASRVDSLYFWKKPTGEVYIFVEQNGVLYVQYGNKGQGSTYTGFSWFFDDVEIVAENRAKVPSQFIPFGNRILIINGIDAPLWLKSPQSFRDFSFTLPTPQPYLIKLQPTYPQGDELETGTGAPYFKDDAIIGLGDTTGKRNNYFWKMTYVLDSGAESPLSSSDNINWVITQSAEEPEYKFGVVMELPIAPKGTVARRLYRTKNCLNNEETYYFVKEIEENGSSFYVDIFDDAYLVTPAPSSLNSSIISTDWKQGESWDNRIWLAKEKKIIYSDSGIPEQFNAINFFDLGNTEGGQITALKAYYNNLIVFRENAVNVIRFSAAGGYTLAVVSSSVGTLSPQAITIAPVVGLTFINESGVWSLRGGLDGGSTITINKISQDIDNEWSSINRKALSSAISAYSESEKELWIHYASGYNQYPDKGVVLHLNRQDLSWSFRGASTIEEDDLFYFSAMSVDFAGRFVFGSLPNWSNDWNNLNSKANLFGTLHVWCASHYHSQKAQLISIVDNLYTYSIAKNNRVKSEWASSWFEWDNGMIRIHSVELEMIAQGDTKVSIEYYKDFQLDPSTTAYQKQADSKIVFTTSEPPVTVPAAFSSVTKSPFKIATSRVHGDRRTVLRFDTRTELSDNFKFVVLPENQEVFELVAFKIDHIAQEIPKMNQSIRLNKGQPR